MWTCRRIRPDTLVHWISFERLFCCLTAEIGLAVHVSCVTWWCLNYRCCCYVVCNQLILWNCLDEHLFRHKNESRSTHVSHFCMISLIGQFRAKCSNRNHMMIFEIVCCSCPEFNMWYIENCLQEWLFQYQMSRGALIFCIISSWFALAACFMRNQVFEGELWALTSSQADVAR